MPTMDSISASVMRGRVAVAAVGVFRLANEAELAECGDAMSSS